MKPYFEKPRFILYHGSCLDVLKNLKPNSVDMIFADPPYNLSNDGFSVHAGRRVSVNKGKWDKSQGAEKDFTFHLNWIEACRNVLKPSGTIWISGTYHSIYQCGYALQMHNFKILNDITWFKPNASPNLSCRCFTASHETLIWARKSLGGRHRFNYQIMKDGDWPGDFLKKPKEEMRSFWVINTSPQSEKKLGKHPTQKPLKLLDRIIVAATKENDLILDPFSGSSTTGLAAIKYKRKFVGIDLDSEYLNLSIKRYNALVSELDGTLVPT